jgi:toxin ParE1/3/4
LSRIELAPEVADDFDRILDHLAEFDAKDRNERIHEIVQAIGVLENNPLIGRPVVGKMNELIIGRDAHGYVALYRYVAAIDTVFVLAIRAQCEAGYVRK